jgi:DNA repair exonuclease SbcCD ATPase subunit
LNEDKFYIDVARNLLQDSGIKTKIVKQYLPIMNKLVNTYLSSMDFFVNFNIDENFNETIKSRFRDEFSYASFSEGEKMRIDLALLFTWRAIAKMKNSTNTNLLILDEIFDSSLDNTGTDDFLKILNTFDQQNVFVISHKQDMLFDKFRNIIQFKKEKNFSRMV